MPQGKSGAADRAFPPYAPTPTILRDEFEHEHISIKTLCAELLDLAETLTSLDMRDKAQICKLAASTIKGLSREERWVRVAWVKSE